MNPLLLFPLGTVAILVLSLAATWVADRRLRVGGWAWRAVHLGMAVLCFGWTIVAGYMFIWVAK